MSVIYNALNKLKKSKEGLRKQANPDHRSDSNVIIFDDLLKKHAVTTYTIIILLAIAMVYLLYIFSQANVVPATRSPQSKISYQKLPASPEEVSADIRAEKTAEIAVVHIKLDPVPTEPDEFPQEEPATTAFAFTSAKPSAKEAPTETEQPVYATPIIRTQHLNIPPSPLTEPAKQTKVDFFVPEGNSHTASFPHPTLTPATPLNVPPPQTQNQAARELHPRTTKTIRHSTDFSPVIHSLNEELRQSIRLHDFESGREILQELENLLGKDSYYILNLTAYFHIQNNDLDEAREILDQILQQDATDLDAGLNMIVVLCRQGKLKPASRRINALLDYYPANPTLLHFKQQLGE